MFALQQQVSVPSETTYGEVRCQCCACRGASFGLRVCVDGSLLLLHAARLLSIRKSNTHLESQHGTVQVRGERCVCSLYIVASRDGVFRLKGIYGGFVCFPSLSGLRLLWISVGCRVFSLCAHYLPLLL